MLTEEQKYENKIRYLELLTKLNIDLTNLNKYLEYCNYFNAPASTMYYKAYSGGLCENALAVYDELMKLTEQYYPGQYKEEDIIKVSLFRDIYKAELYEPYTKKTVNPQTNLWEDTIAYKAKEAGNRATFGDVGFSSYMVAKHFIEFSDEQTEAICFGYCKDFGYDIHDVRRSYPLVTLTIMADMIISYIR